MTTEIPTQYDPKAIESSIYARWLKDQAFAAHVDDRDGRYVIMMPLPNVTGALHMGHAMDNVMQDLLIRWHRMQGENTLWQPGTDHAGIATQAVVEKRLFELERKTRHDVGRDGLIERIWQWKDQYQARIVKQQQAMGCSCDWDRQRFTMDAVCTAAVRESFYRLFKDKLIYRGSRLVNWDCYLQTAVSDDEVVRENKKGGFWHLRYPVIDPQPGEPSHVVVATTRPETMLGDTAVATHPEPRRQLERVLEKLRERLAKAPGKEKPAIEKEIERVEDRQREVLPRLEKLVEMAKAGRMVRLPLQERPIPLILDEWAKPELGSGCVKITPAHDPNDYDVWTRHRDRIEQINILNRDGTLNKNAGAYQGIDRMEARKRVVADLEAKDLLEAVEERENELGISDRSKTVIEPFLSRQWFVRMGDVDGGVVFGRGTRHEFRGPGLAQAAIDAVSGDWRSPTGRKLTFHPDADRYGSTYINWLAEKRDWCIGRQLWWGHRVPIWAKEVDAADLDSVIGALPKDDQDRLWCWIGNEDGEQLTVDEARARTVPAGTTYDVQVCLRDEASTEQHAPALESAGFVRDEDVLDTWFSSALWPFSTLGWPNPAAAAIGDGQRPLGPSGAQASSLDYYYPGSCLVTGRDIITLWVARMQILGLYCLGDLPFTDCFIHANIQDGKGERMSKSKGNGIDPVDIIDRYGTDAMRYVLCDMQTGMQDIRLPVQVTSPFTGKELDLANIKHGRNADGSLRLFTYLDPDTGEEFDVLGTMEGMPEAKPFSNRFEVGRNFCNKLWNAARFALLNLDGYQFGPLTRDQLAPEDRWILSRLARAIADTTGQLERYNPSAAVSAARDFFWNEFCDWYLELVKPRMQGESRHAAGQVLAFVLDQSARLFQPFIPFITESLWERLAQFTPKRGIEAEIDVAPLVATAAWPVPREADVDDRLEREFDLMQSTVRAVRDLRARYGVPPKQEVDAVVKASGDALGVLQSYADQIRGQARLGSLEIAADPAKPKNAATGVDGEVEVYVAELVDPAKERERLEKQRDKVSKALRGVEGKLKNEKFVSNAPAEVVEAEKKRLGEYQAELDRIEVALQSL